MRRSWACPAPEDAQAPELQAQDEKVPSRVLLLLRPLVATPLKTPLMSRLLRRRRRMGVEPNRKLRKRWPPPQGRRQESVARVVPGPSH